MEGIFSIVVGLFFATSVYLFLSRHLIRVLIGVAILGNAVNLLIFTTGKITKSIPPIVPKGLSVPAEVIANPLPQALILTAIVISFSFFAFLLVLSYRAFEDLGTDNLREMRVAEPENETMPPLGY